MDNGHLHGDDVAGDVLPVAFRPTRANYAGFRREDLLPLLAEGRVRQLCLWGESGTVEVFRTRLRRVLRSNHLYDALLKVTRVTQPNGRTRFDLFCATPMTRRVLRSLQRSTVYRQYRWHCRLHRAYIDRRSEGPTVSARRRELPPANPDASGNLRVGTYNVNGLKGKRLELRAFLGITKLDVLGIQETLLKANDWSFRIPHYVCYTSGGAAVRAHRGVALAVSKRFTSMPVGPASPSWIFVRVMGGNLRKPLVVGTAYVPSQRGGQPVLHGLARAVSSIRGRHPDDVIVLVGDFNRSLAELQRITSGWPIPLSVLPNRGNVPTHSRGRAIDHIAYWGNPDVGTIPPAKVLEDWDISDHQPVVGRIPYLVDRAVPAQAMAEAMAMGRQRIQVQVPEKRRDIASNNYWAPLAEECLEMDDVTAIASRWTEGCHEVATDLGLHSKPFSGKSTLSKSTLRRIARRRQRYKALREALRRQVRVAEAREAYHTARTRCRKRLHRQADKKWRNQVRLAHARLLHRPKRYWRWANSTAGWRGKDSAAGIQPVYDEETGALLTQLEDITKAWGGHYERLARDVTGNSQNPDRWTRIAADDRLEPLDDLNADISRDEVWAALLRMKMHKAPGQDGIPTDFIKALLRERPRSDADENVPPPPSPMSDTVTHLLNLVFTKGEIPNDWTTSEVVSLPKDGDLACMDNYRGISLMSCTLKILLVIVSDRINRAAERSQRFHDTQAGFRSLEEAITQAACVVEILQRRRIAGLRTYAIFVDLKKAYDTVPHQGLFAKLQRFGVRGTCLEFIRALYANSTISVRVGSGQTAQHSEPCRLLRGVRQG